MTPNRAMFIETLAHIELDPATWNQGTWGSAYLDKVPAEARPTPGRNKLLEIDPLAPACGTAFCFAGWTSVIAGDKRMVHDAGELAWDLTTVVGRDGELTSVSSSASRHLGVDNTGDLFGANNTLARVYQISANLLAGKPGFDLEENNEDTAQLYREVRVRVKELRAERKAYVEKLRKKAEGTGPAAKKARFKLLTIRRLARRNTESRKRGYSVPSA